MHERRRRGQQVTVVAPGPVRANDPGAGVHWLQGGGAFGPPGALVRLRENPLRARGALEFCLRARRLLDRLAPFDELVAHWVIPAYWPIVPEQVGPVEAVAHGSDVRLLARLPRLLRRRVTAALLRDGVRVRCVSERVATELLAATTSELAERLRVAPSPFELPAGLDRGQARARLGLPTALELAVIVGRLIPEKRVAVALRAVALLPGVRVVVVGGGPLLVSLAREFPSVQFTGELPRPEALCWIAAADVLVSASLHEGAPTVVREARALGTPVVARAAGSLRALAATDPGVWLLPEPGEP